MVSSCHGFKSLHALAPRQTLEVGKGGSAPARNGMRAVKEAGLDSKVRFLRHGEMYDFRARPERLKQPLRQTLTRLRR